MINLTNDDYLTVLIDAGKIEDGSTVFKPQGDVDYVLCTEKPSFNSIIYTDTRRYGTNKGMVYLKHSNGKYYAYPKNKPLRVRVDKYDLQRIIDESCEY